jgi:hypothetical protein
MNRLLLASCALALTASGVFAAPPPGVGGGPPAFVTMGPPAFVTTGPPAFVTTGPPAGITHGPPPAALGHIPAGVPGKPTTLPVGDSSIGGSASAEANAASELGKLNAAHASPVAFAHANPNSAVGAIATYQSQMNSALALTDPMEKDAAITSARQQLGLISNKQLTPSAISKIDGLLGITGADPTLGTTP